jgi:hypothetical protein
LRGCLQPPVEGRIGRVARKPAAIVALIRKGVADGSKPDNCDPADGLVHLIKMGRTHLNA